MAANNPKAVASLVLGIVGIVGILFACLIVCSPIAIILGYQARNEIAASGGWQTGESSAKAGIILGWVGLAIYIALFTIYAIIFAVAASSSSVIIPFP